MRAFLSRLLPSNRAFLAVLLAGLAFRLLYAWLCVPHLRLVGDEKHYFACAADLIRLFGSLGSLSSPETVELVDRIVGRGWFMPGMSLVVLPARLLTDDLLLVRLYLGVLNTLLFAALVWRTDRILGRGAAFWFAALAGLFPVFVSYAFVLWGEAIAIQVAMLLLLHLQSLPVRWLERPPGKLHAAGLGVVLVTLVYLRPSLLSLPQLVLGVVFVQLLAHGPVRTACLRWLRFALPLGAVMAMGIAPWSWALSQRMEGFFLTTTSLRMNRITAFAPREAVAGLTHDGASAYSTHRYIRSVMLERGVGYSEAMRIVSERLLKDVGFADYVRAVRHHVREYFLDPVSFASRQATVVRRGYSEAALERQPGDPHESAESRRARTEELPGRATRVLFLQGMQLLDRVLWYALLIAFLGILLLPLQLPARWSFMTSLKGLFWVNAVHPFVSAVHYRHFAVLVPVLALGVAVCFGRERPRLFTPGRCTNTGQRWLLAGEWLSLFFLLVGFTLLLGPWDVA